MATNKIESLDPALIRPGRIDRKIEFPLPDTKTKRRIFGIHTGRMTLSEDVNLEEFIMAKARFRSLPCGVASAIFTSSVWTILWCSLWPRVGFCLAPPPTHIYHIRRVIPPYHTKH